MKRKKALKKLYPQRHKILKALHSGNHLVEINDRRGNPIILNFMKHALYQRPYKNFDYQVEMLRRLQKKWEENQKKKEKEVVVEGT